MHKNATTARFPCERGLGSLQNRSGGVGKQPFGLGTSTPHFAEHIVSGPFFKKRGQLNLHDGIVPTTRSIMIQKRVQPAGAGHSNSADNEVLKQLC